MTKPYFWNIAIQIVKFYALGKDESGGKRKDYATRHRREILKMGSDLIYSQFG